MLMNYVPTTSTGLGDTKPHTAVGLDGWWVYGRGVS